MFSRPLQCRHSIITTPLRTRTQTASRATHYARHFTRSAIARSENADQHNGHQQPPKFRGPRPITVFAVCIPLGFVINWVLKEQKESAVVSEDGFVKYVLTNKEDVSSTCAVFTLRPASPAFALEPSGGSESREASRGVISAEIKQPQLQIARSYTILPPPGGSDLENAAHSDGLRFLIRKEEGGEVSGYLHRLSLGADVEIRGFDVEYQLPTHKKIDNIIFLAGGTGIAPALQLASIVPGETSLQILWANRRREDCMGGLSEELPVTGWTISKWWKGERQSVGVSEKGTIVQELEALQSTTPDRPRTLRIQYFVDEEDTFIQPKHVSRLLQKTAHTSATRLSEQGGDKTPQNVLVVSGPPGFVNYWVGAKQWEDGREAQGPLGGVLASMDLRGWKVVKL